MPYVPKLKHLLKILFFRRDPRAAEGLYFEGMWLSDNGDDVSARQAFLHAAMLDRQFGGAYYNYAALCEKLEGTGSPTTLKAWRRYLKVARDDRRQAREIVAKVEKHVAELEKPKR